MNTWQGFIGALFALFIAINMSALPAQFEEERDDSFLFVQELPRFAGCENLRRTTAYKRQCSQQKMLEFISQHIKYPANARAKRIMGMVVINLIVDRQGKLINASILKDIGGGCAEEALRIIKLMPDWIPAKHRGEAVKAQFTIPIQFYLPSVARASDKTKRLSKHRL